MPEDIWILLLIIFGCRINVGRGQKRNYNFEAIAHMFYMNQRILYIDVLKAFAIFLVVLGHVCQNYGGNVEKPIYHFGILPYHMPLFAILSGLFFTAQTDARNFVGRKFNQIAIPFLVWCFFAAVIVRGVDETYLHYTEGYPIHLKSWLAGLYMYIIDWGWWFLRDLFMCFIYAYISIRLCKCNVLLGVCLSVILLYGLSLLSIIPNKCWSDFIFLFPFFCTGILMKEYKESILRYAERFLIISTVTFVICMSYWKGYSDTFYSMNTSMLAEEGYAGITGWMVPVKMIYRYITGVSASFMLILLARRLEVYLPTSPLMMRIGRNTLGIYILHGFVFQIFAPPVQTYCSKTR